MTRFLLWHAQLSHCRLASVPPNPYLAKIKSRNEVTAFDPFDTRCASSMRKLTCFGMASQHTPNRPQFLDRVAGQMYLLGIVEAIVYYYYFDCRARSHLAQLGERNSSFLGLLHDVVIQGSLQLYNVQVFLQLANPCRLFSIWMVAAGWLLPTQVRHWLRCEDLRENLQP